MKAILHTGRGGPERLRLTATEDRHPGPQEVKIRLKSAGLNHRDLFVMQDRPQPDLPWIPGSDGAGTVEEIGAEVQGFTVGKEIVIHPTLGWNRTADLPPVPDILGGPTDGTFAEFAIIPAENAFPKPAFLSWAEAGVLPLSALTAYRALFSQGKLQAGEHLLIIGIGGGVATYALMMAKAIGASVTVTSRSQEKLRKAIKLGADRGLDNAANWATESNTGTVDLILDSVGGAVFPRFFPLLNPGGRIVSLGASTEARIELSLRELFFSQFSLIGTSMGSREEFIEMLHFIEIYRIRPVVDSVHALPDTAKAFDRLTSGEQFGNVSISIAP